METTGIMNIIIFLNRDMDNLFILDMFDIFKVDNEHIEQMRHLEHNRNIEHIGHLKKLNILEIMDKSLHLKLFGHTIYIINS